MSGGTDVTRPREGGRQDHTDGQCLAWLSGMVTIRAFEERVQELRQTEQIIGSVHLCIGQEAIPVGVCDVLEPQDAVFATYRGHGWALASGCPVRPAFAELLGRETGFNAGRGGSAYFSAPEHRFYGENSIVGGGAPLATGAALAARYDGSRRVAISVFGDGAMNQGAVHEALNFAAALTLPVVFICENNGYSELTPISAMVRSARLSERAAGYGMPGVRIDGNDPATVRDAAQRAVERARTGAGPTLIEAVTERLVGHYIGDAETYRPGGEVERARQREPLRRLRGVLGERGVPTRRMDEVEGAARLAVDEAMAAALRDPPADAARARDGLYA